MHKLAKRPPKDPLLGAGAQHQTPNLQKKMCSLYIFRDAKWVTEIHLHSHQCFLLVQWGWKSLLSELNQYFYIIDKKWISVIIQIIWPIYCSCLLTYAHHNSDFSICCGDFHFCFLWGFLVSCRLSLYIFILFPPVHALKYSIKFLLLNKSLQVSHTVSWEPFLKGSPFESQRAAQSDIKCAWRARRVPLLLSVTNTSSTDTVHDCSVVTVWRQSSWWTLTAVTFTTKWCWKCWLAAQIPKCKCCFSKS